MIRKIATPILIAGALALVAVFGALTYKNVAAQEETPTPAAPFQDPPGRGMRGGPMGQTNEDLADALGITVEELQAAQKTAAAEALKQAVADGLLTQEQADQMAERGLGGWPMKGLGRPGESSIDMQALLADALGISAEDLQAAQEKAFAAALARAVDEGTLTQEQADLIQARRALYGSESFQASMKSAFENAVAQAVKDGLITQAQADQILAENAGAGFFGRGGFGPGFGGGRGGHGHFGPGPLPGNQPPADDAEGSGL